MKRHFLFILGIPLIIIFTLIFTEQFASSASNLEFAPVDWPSSGPQYMQSSPPQVDLAIGKRDFPDPAAVGAPLTYTLTITNQGLMDVSNVIVVDPLPLNVVFDSVTSSQGTCSLTSNIILCHLGTLTSFTTATVTIAVIPTRLMVVANTAIVTSSSPTEDENPENNSDTEETLVNFFAAPPPNALYFPFIVKQ